MNIIVNVCTILCLSLFLFSSFIPIIIDNNKKKLFFIVLLNSPQFVCFNIYRSWSECVDVEEIEWKNKNTDYARFSLWMNDFFLSYSIVAISIELGIQFAISLNSFLLVTSWHFFQLFFIQLWLFSTKNIVILSFLQQCIHYNGMTRKLILNA